MTFVRCYNCGRTNDAESTFCVQCATSLRHTQLKLQSKGRVMVPPQDNHQATPPRRATSTFPSGLLWLVGIIVVGTLLIWFLFSRG